MTERVAPYAGNSQTSAAAPTTTTAGHDLSVDTAGPVVLVGAGDIASCTRTTDDATAELLDTIPGEVFTLGDNAYGSGSETDYADCYDPSWGRHKTRTHPTPGNKDYTTPGAPGYFAYFGAAAGDPAKGYYSYDLGDWHIVVLNDRVPMGTYSAQMTWLKADLAASSTACTIAYWHAPRFWSDGSSWTYKPAWEVLYNAGVEIVLNGDKKNYERFAPQDPDGDADSLYGIRQFIVGTGGADWSTPFGTPRANSEARITKTYGVLKLTLERGSYTWEFVPVAGMTGTDRGTGSCHGPLPPVTSVSISPESTVVQVRNSVQLTATGRYENGERARRATFAWTSADPEVASVSADGSVTGMRVGHARIVASSGTGADTVTIAVRQDPAVVELDPTDVSVLAGDTARLVAIVRDSGGIAIPDPVITWISWPSDVASVSSSGLLTGVAAGSGTVTASVAGVSATVSVEVIAPRPPPSRGIWISGDEIASLPMSGSAWTNLKSAASASCGTPVLSSWRDRANTCVLAKALFFARTGSLAHRDSVVEMLRAIINSGTYSGQALALGRELAAYVIAADIVGLSSHAPGLDEQFRAKLIELRATFTVDGPGSLISCHEVRPNNWGTACGATRAAIAAYLDDQAELDRTAQVFKGWLGDRSSYSGFKFQEKPALQDARTWSPTPTALVAVNPKGATVTWNGASYNVDGALIDDISRGCATFQWEPCRTDYPWEGLGGAIVQAEILQRRGYAAYEWEDQAIRRAYEYLLYLHAAIGGFWWDEGTVVGDDNWQPWIVNMRYGLSLPARTPTRPGKTMGWSDWTHARSASP